MKGCLALWLHSLLQLGFYICVCVCWVLLSSPSYDLIYKWDVLDLMPQSGCVSCPHHACDVLQCSFITWPCAWLSSTCCSSVVDMLIYRILLYAYTYSVYTCHVVVAVLVIHILLFQLAFFVCIHMVYIISYFPCCIMDMLLLQLLHCIVILTWLLFQQVCFTY